MNEEQLLKELTEYLETQTSVKGFQLLRDAIANADLPGQKFRNYSPILVLFEQALAFQALTNSDNWFDFGKED